MAARQTTIIADGGRVSNKQPNSRHCFVCGVENPSGLKLKFFEIQPGEVVADYTVPEQFQGFPGVVHGGIIAAMLDEVAGRAYIRGDPPRFMYTAKMEIRYRKNVPVGQPLRLVGKAGRTKNRSATARGEIFNQGGELLVEADLLLVNVPDELYVSSDLEALGWKVYQD
jgi:uncharacterized protein (TIGR00369 family)